MNRALSRAALRWGFAAIYRKREVAVADAYAPMVRRVRRKEVRDERQGV